MIGLAICRIGATHGMGQGPALRSYTSGVSLTPSTRQYCHRRQHHQPTAANTCGAGAEPAPLGIATDDRDHLREKIEEGIEHDILLLSGGVSAGKLDLVPPELESAGVRLPASAFRERAMMNDS